MHRHWLALMQGAWNSITTSENSLDDLISSGNSWDGLILSGILSLQECCQIASAKMRHPKAKAHANR